MSRMFVYPSAHQPNDEEWHIVELVLRGQSTWAISQHTGHDPETVRALLESALKKLRHGGAAPSNGHSLASPSYGR